MIHIIDFSAGKKSYFTFSLFSHFFSIKLDTVESPITKVEPLLHSLLLIAVSLLFNIWYEFFSVLLKPRKSVLFPSYLFLDLFLLSLITITNGGGSLLLTVFTSECEWLSFDIFVLLVFSVNGITGEELFLWNCSLFGHVLLGANMGSTILSG